MYAREIAHLVIFLYIYLKKTRCHYFYARKYIEFVNSLRILIDIFSFYQLLFLSIVFVQRYLNFIKA